jgi:curved DNA-binding protein CbpA
MRRLTVIRQTHYAVLKVPEDADPATIRQAFRSLVRSYHPDMGAGSSATKFRAVMEAYTVLREPSQRREYDATLVRSRSQKLNMTEPLMPFRSKATKPKRSRRVTVARDPFDVSDAILDQIIRSIDAYFTS